MDTKQAKATPQQQNRWLQLPKYRSHKVVVAGQIVRIERTGLNYETYPDGDSGFRWHINATPGQLNPQIVVVIVSNALLHRDAPRRPKVEDFYVRYDDGYESWSPAKAFIAGYTLVEGDAPEPERPQFDPWAWMRQWLDAYGLAHPEEAFDADKIMEWIQGQPMTEYRP